MSFSKSLDLKIIRTRYVVSFYNNTSAIDLIKDLEQVPKEAKVLESKDAYDNKHEESTNRQHMIVFELEEKIA